MRTLAIDIETFSTVDLKKSGMYKYVEASTFVILLFAYSVNGGPVQVIDIASGEKLPAQIASDLNNPAVNKTAWNAAFERTCIAKHFGFIQRPEQWECSMAKAAQLGLPLSLDQASKALNIEDGKMTEGKRLIRFFTIPCKPTIKNGQRNRNLPEHSPEEWDKFKQYCAQDVKVEQEVRNKISFFEFSKAEKDIWNLDQKINDTGILLDPPLIKNAIRFDLAFAEALTKEAAKLTGLENPNSVKQIKDWILSETGEEVKSLNKETVPVLLKNASCEVVKRVLELRQQMSKTSVKKYLAMHRAICTDDRFRGIGQYYGARTGRWAGRLVQPHNLPKNKIPDLDLARQLVKSGDMELMEMCYGNVSDILSQLIRTAFIAPKGSRFIPSDFSAIEARVLAWLAGEKWRIDVFNTHGKIYEASGAHMFKVPIESVTKGSDLRDKAKIAELACIAKGQLVLTDRGLVEIQSVTTAHRLWDGLSFVSHRGVVSKGIKKVITYDGLTATEDHLVWVQGQKEPIRFGLASTSGAHLLRSGDDRKAIRVGRNYISREKMEERLERSNGSHSMQRVFCNSVDLLLQSHSREIKRLPGVFAAKANPEMVRQKIDFSQTAVHKFERWELHKLWSPGNRVSISNCTRSGSLDKREFRNTRQGTGIGPREQRWPLRARQPEICTSTYQSVEQEEIETFDIINAGPFNRFTVSDCLVHNCGYQGGVGALLKMGALKMGLTEEELPGIIKQWRAANKKIVEYWYEVGNTAIAAVENGGMAESLSHGITMYVRNNIFYIELPSGRKLAYQSPKLKDGKYGPVLTFLGVDKTWHRQETYGGKLVENIVQAVARDLLADAMLRVDAAGYKIVLHVHDEIVPEMPYGQGSAEEVQHIMSQPIPWAKGLPLSADAYETEYYRKD